jgi:hypothetical protein
MLGYFFHSEGYALHNSDKKAVGLHFARVSNKQTHLVTLRRSYKTPSGGIFSTLYHVSITRKSLAFQGDQMSFWKKIAQNAAQPIFNYSINFTV